jgi:hypothetical protein
LGVDRTPNATFMQVSGKGFQVATDVFLPLKDIQRQSCYFYAVCTPTSISSHIRLWLRQNITYTSDWLDGSRCATTASPATIFR